VEVFNRESKQLLNLGRYQSSKFDAQVAKTTISMIVSLLLKKMLSKAKAEAMIKILCTSVMGKDD
jgi:hypothetical protein